MTIGKSTSTGTHGTGLAFGGLATQIVAAKLVNGTGDRPKSPGRTRVVVNKETVPVERVKLGTETVTDEQQVSEEVRKEQIEADLPEEATRRENTERG